MQKISIYHLSVLLSLILLFPALAFAEGDVREEIARLQRLELTCSELTGPDLPKMLSATLLEAVRLYQGENYDPALDSILLAYALQPKDTPAPYYGVQTGRVEVKVRRPDDSEKKLLPVNASQYCWLMIAVANTGDAKLDLTGIRATVTDAKVRGKVYKSIAPGDPEAEKALGEKKGFLLPGAVNSGATATFVLLFPAFTEWSEMAIEDQANKIIVSVKNYPLVADAGRQMKATRAVAAIADKQKEVARVEREKAAKEPPAPKPGVKPKPGEKEQPPVVAPKKDEYVLVGYIRNEILKGKYGIQLLQGAKVAGETAYFVRIGQQTVAELKPMGTGTIAEISGRARIKPSPGDSVYIKKK